MLSEFKTFIARGNVIDLAVGVIIGAAFGKIVTSLVDDVIMPPIGMMLGKVDFTQLKIVLQPGDEKSEVAIRYGSFMNTAIQFVIVAFVIFIIVRAVNKMKREPAPADPTTKTCPMCQMDIPIAAKKCGHCTSEIA